MNEDIKQFADENPTFCAGRLFEDLAPDYCDFDELGDLDSTNVKKLVAAIAIVRPNCDTSPTGCCSHAHPGCVAGLRTD